MKMISDLSWDLVEEILSKAPITSLGAVRSTCKRWNALSKDRLLCKAEAKHQFLGFMMKNSKFCSLRFDLHGHEEFADPSVIEISNLFNQVKISELVLCDGLLLCIPKRHQEPLMVWNPYIGQTRWIKKGTPYDEWLETFALGYDNSKNRNHKILRHCGRYNKSEIYDFKSDSWRVLDVSPDSYGLYQRSASLKGNSYFLDINEHEGAFAIAGSFHCFDFTTERFRQFLDLPWSTSSSGFVTALFSLREEKLTALSMCTQTFVFGIWVTTKIDPNAVSWSNILRTDLEAIPHDFWFTTTCFFIDEEKKVVVLFGAFYSDRITDPETSYNKAYIIGENEILKAVNLGEVISPSGFPVVCSSSYVPSLVQIKRKTNKKRKQANKL